MHTLPIIAAGMILRTPPDAVVSLPCRTGAGEAYGFGHAIINL
jgi:hypothetical protein